MFGKREGSGGERAGSPELCDRPKRLLTTDFLCAIIYYLSSSIAYHPLSIVCYLSPVAGIGPPFGREGGSGVVILGIDPGLAIVGYGVIEYQNGRFRTLAYGAVTTPAHTAVEQRLALIHRDLCALLRKYRPDEMAVEELFFTNNITTGIAVAEARGVILLAAAENGVPVSEYTPLQVKQAVVGYGKAEKKQVLLMVQTILGLSKMPKLDDTADALAIAICHAHTKGSRLKSFYNLS